ncbi:MAG TPA: acetyl-CoA carboxylase biotin carboxylase subunit, partial [Nitrososphaeraceae archaeon]
KNALNEFTVEGINTTIPLFKTIMDEDNFIKGELSTDYLERFHILERMNRDALENAKKDLIPAVSAILLRSEFIKKSHLYQKGTSVTPRVGWQSKG